MSRKLLLSAISIAATATLLGAGAYAKFTDSEVSLTNKVAAGTLDLSVLNDPYPEYVPFDVKDAVPGMTTKGQTPSQTKMVHFKNVGNVAGNLSVKVVLDTNDENGVQEPEPAWDTTASGELAQNMLVSIDGLGAMIDQPLTTLAAMAPVYHSTLAPGGEGWVSVDWSIPSTVGNEIMSDSVSFHLEFTLEQL
jgi:predicted ribosomally synthesized peptide with SipW-like signal peptide